MFYFLVKCKRIFRVKSTGTTPSLNNSCILHWKALVSSSIVKITSDYTTCNLQSGLSSVERQAPCGRSIDKGLIELPTIL